MTSWPKTRPGRFTPLCRLAARVLAAVFVTAAAQAAPAGAQETSHDPGIDADHPLVGVWAAQVDGEGPSGAREIGMRIHADGIMEELGSRPMGRREWSGSGDRAWFRVSRNILSISMDRERWAPFARFRFTNGGDLVFTYLQDESVRTWHRIR